LSQLKTRLKKLAIFLHRWLGVTLCLLFACWFLSGIFMMYCDFPGVTAEDRLERAPALDASKIHLALQAAYDRLALQEPADQASLGTYDGRPAYRFLIGRTHSLVYADNGSVQNDFPPALLSRVAAAWTGLPPAVATVQANTEEDQWTVSGQFRPLRPLLKYSWPDGEEVYVSTVSGEVVQYTTRSSRLLAYLGPIPHWLYFTPLRKQGQVWSRTVIWLSGLGTFAAILGLTVGIWMYSPSKRYSMRGALTSIPYTGQKRLHTIAGLLFGITACTWVFSGMLSMDPFPVPSPSEEVGARIAGALRDNQVAPALFAVKPEHEVLAQLASIFPVKELKYLSIAGEPAYLAFGLHTQTRIVPLSGEPVAALDRNLLVDVIRRAIQPLRPTEVRVVTQYESYYVDRHGRLPLPALFLKLNDPGGSMYYVDPKTALVVQRYDSISRPNRWLYHGLHSMDIPWLYAHRPAWDIAVLLLMLGGTALSVTSLILATQVVERKHWQWRRR
jgi:hypothetical protein